MTAARRPGAARGARALAVVAVVAALLGAGRAARADGPTVGLFAPSAPFPSTAARVELAGALGRALGGTGRTFARAADFAAAVKRGEVTVAVVDAAYLATAGGGATVLAAAVRPGDAPWGWQLVAADGAASGRIAALAGKRLLVPSVGGREADFVIGALLGFEVRRDHFARIDTAPDTASALAALGLGKADAAVVPTGVALPPGISVVLALPVVAGPMLVAFGAPTAEARAALVAAAAAFTGDATLAGFRAADGEGVRALARRYAPPERRGPLVVPSARARLGELVEGRRLEIERTPPARFVARP